MTIIRSDHGTDQWSPKLSSSPWTEVACESGSDHPDERATGDGRARGASIFEACLALRAASAAELSMFLSFTIRFTCRPVNDRNTESLRFKGGRAR